MRTRLPVADTPNFMSNYQIQANEIAANFASQMAAHFTPAQLDSVSDDNAKESSPHICHSHDLCDANELMAVAFRSVVGRDIDLQSDADTALWGAAFDAYRYHGSRIGRALAACGFELQFQGGNLFNWRKQIAPGLDCFCCDSDGCEPVDGEAACLGIALAASDSLAEKLWASGAELARALNSRLS